MIPWAAVWHDLVRIGSIGWTCWGLRRTWQALTDLRKWARRRVRKWLKKRRKRFED